MKTGLTVSNHCDPYCQFCYDIHIYRNYFTFHRRMFHDIHIDI